VQRVIFTTKRRKAPGEDGISTAVLRHLPITVRQYLFVLFSSALSLGHFPRCWKLAKVIPILKPKKPPSQLESYRPISPLSAISKFLERVVARRLAAHAKQTQLVPDEQFGFRKKHSTTAQLARITDLITHGYNLRKHTGMVTLDLEKAYDTIWINGLLYKLIQNEFPAYLITFLFSYLRDRTFSVVINGAQLTPRTQRASLPQGAVLSPILFSYYISDIPRLQHIHTALYADDAALLTQSWRVDTVARRHTSAIIHIKKYFDRWRLKLNTAKTEAILFTKRRQSTTSGSPDRRTSVTMVLGG
jgi:hypothetical protein